MGLKKFVDLWRHRYCKYTHIAKAHLIGNQATASFRKFKRNCPDKKLIAVVRTEHFGDIVAVEPLARQLRTLYPSDNIVWFVKPVFKELVETNPHIDEVFPEYCVTQRQVIIDSGVFDMVHQLQFRNNNHCPTCQKFYDNPVALEKDIHVGNYFENGNLLEVFAAVGNVPLPADQQPRLYLQPSHRERVDRLDLPENFIVIHCKSNFAPKDWPALQWTKLINWLTENYRYSVVEVGLKSDLTVKHPGYFNLTGKLSILETAEVIRRADFFIGLDSGPAHLANAVNTHGFILMGSLGNFESYNPYSGNYGAGKNCTLIRKTGRPCSELSFEQVTNSIKSVLSSELIG